MSMPTVICLRLWRAWQGFRQQRLGQDIIEYALMAGLVATGVVTMSPNVATAFADMMSKVNSVVVVAGAS